MPSLGVSSLDLGRQPRSRPLLYVRVRIATATARRATARCALDPPAPLDGQIVLSLGAVAIGALALVFGLLVGPGVAPWVGSWA
jgi:hypothetical protein